MIEPLRSTPILPLSALRQACCPELAMKFGTLWMLWLLVGLAIKVNALAFLIGPLWVVARPGLKELWHQDRSALLKRGAGFATLGALLVAWLLLGPRSDAIITTLLDSTWPGKLLGYAADGANDAGTISEFGQAPIPSRPGTR